MCNRIDHFDDRLAALAERGHRRSEEDREHHDLQDLVARHGIDDARRNGVCDEALQRQRVGLHVRGRVSIRQGKLHRLAGFEQLHQHQPERERDQRGKDEPAERLAADASDGGDIAHFRDADDERRQHQRRDDHLDQPQEHGRQKRGRFRESGGRFRIERVADVTADQAEHEADDDEGGQAIRRHRDNSRESAYEDQQRCTGDDAVPRKGREAMRLDVSQQPLDGNERDDGRDDEADGQLGPVLVCHLT